MNKTIEKEKGDKQQVFLLANDDSTDQLGSYHDHIGTVSEKSYEGELNEALQSRTRFTKVNITHQAEKLY
jgi:hypothetical protein